MTLFFKLLLHLQGEVLKTSLTAQPGSLSIRTGFGRKGRKLFCNQICYQISPYLDRSVLQPINTYTYMHSLFLLGLLQAVGSKVVHKQIFFFLFC